MRARPVRRPLLLIAVAVALAASAACSSAGEQVSEKIAEQAQKTLKLSEQPPTTCPDDAKAKKGAKFDCTLTIEKTTVSVGVVFTDDTHFTFTPQAQVFEKPTLLTNLKTYATGQEITLKTVDCPGTKYVVIPNGKTVDCPATDDTGEKGTFVVGLDETGNPVVKSVKQG